jgi:hypothetical protein
MLKRVSKCSFVGFVLFLSIAFITSCSKAPTKEIANAEKALDEARLKEADLYVEDIFFKAEDSLKKAKDLMNEKKYRDAKKAAEECIRLSKEAISLVEVNKKKMKEEAEKLYAELTKEIEDVKAILARSLRSKTPEEQKEIQEMVGKWDLEMINIRDSLKADRIRYAYDGLKPIKEQITAQKEKFTSLTHVEAKK